MNRGRTASEKGNSVVQAVEQVAALYRVPCYREQSVVFTVENGGKSRPIFVGKWTDRFGTEHTKGKPDCLLTPRIQAPVFDGSQIPVGHVRECVPLWCECKFGSGELSDDQKAFRDDVLAAGAYYLECRDSADSLIDWFTRHGVKR